MALVERGGCGTFEPKENMRRPAQQETDEQKRNRELIESIAKNISALARSVQALLNGPLKKRAIVVLLSNSSGLTQKAIESCLTALQDLEKDWLNH